MAPSINSIDRILPVQKTISTHRFLWFFILFIAISPANKAYGETELEWIAQSKIKGTIRSIYQFRELDTKPNEEIYSLGINLKWESAQIYDFNLGSAVYASTDMGLTREGLASQNGVIPVSSIAVFAEAYVQYNKFNTQFRFGRQQVDTPFMNPADSRMFPVTFFGYSLSNKSIPSVEIFATHVTEIKLRQDELFLDTGQFITKRLGIEPANTGGTTAVGVTWAKDNFKLQGWEYFLPDLFNMLYIEGDMTFHEQFGYRPFISFQAGHQFGVGDKLFGKVDAQAYGTKLGVKNRKLQTFYAFNYLPTKQGQFRNGGFLSPYSFATDALYTNMNDGGLTVKDTAFVGWAHTGSIDYQFNESLWAPDWYLPPST